MGDREGELRGRGMQGQRKRGGRGRGNAEREGRESGLEREGGYLMCLLLSLPVAMALLWKRPTTRT